MKAEIGGLLLLLLLTFVFSGVSACECNSDDVYCACAEEGTSGAVIFAYIIGILALICVCITPILCCLICITLAQSPLFVGLLIAVFVLLNTLVAQISIQGLVSDIFKLIFEQWGSMQTLAVVEIAAAPFIGLLASCISNIYITGIAMLLDLLLIGAELFFFYTLFEATSIIPGVTYLSLALGIVIVLLTIWQVITIWFAMRKLLTEMGINPNTCKKYRPEELQIMTTYANKLPAAPTPTNLSIQGSGSFQPPSMYTQSPGSATYQQPPYQQPAYQQPAYQQPAYQQPAYQQPTYHQSLYQQQQPIYQQQQQQSAYQEPSGYEQSLPYNPESVPPPNSSFANASAPPVDQTLDNSNP